MLNIPNQGNKSCSCNILAADGPVTKNVCCLENIYIYLLINSFETDCLAAYGGTLKNSPIIEDR